MHAHCNACARAAGAPRALSHLQNAAARPASERPDPRHCSAGPGASSRTEALLDVQGGADGGRHAAWLHVGEIDSRWLAGGLRTDSGRTREVLDQFWTPLVLPARRRTVVCSTSTAMEDKFHEGYEVAKLAIGRLLGKAPVDDCALAKQLAEGDRQAAIRRKEARARTLTMFFLGMWIGGVGVSVGVSSLGGLGVNDIPTFAGLGGLFGIVFAIVDCVWEGHWEWHWLAAGLLLGLLGGTSLVAAVGLR